MNTISKPNIKFLVGLTLSLPAACFIAISVLKYILGYPFLFDGIWPILEGIGIMNPFGLLNLLILFGPVVALLLNIIAVLHIEFEFTKQNINCQLSVTKSWWNLAVIILSGSILAILYIYLFLENCNCYS
jgi:hypothetical protein